MCCHIELVSAFLKNKQKQVTMSVGMKTIAFDNSISNRDEGVIFEIGGRRVNRMAPLRMQANGIDLGEVTLEDFTIVQEEDATEPTKNMTLRRPNGASIHLEGVQLPADILNQLMGMGGDTDGDR